MAQRLKEEFLRLLKEDMEFRYAVAGLIGLDEILKRLDKHDEKFNEILKRLDRHEEELVKLREETAGLWKEVTRLREDMIKGFERHDKILEEHSDRIAKLREDMMRGFRRYDEILEKHGAEIARLREDMVKGFKRHDEILERHGAEMAKLREDMIKGFKRHDEILERHDAKIAKLREDFNEMLKVVRGLQEGHVRLERRIDSLESAMISGFGELSKFAGMTFEEFVRKFLTSLLRKAREIPESAELKRAAIEGEEINLFLEDPLIVGEVTAYAETVEEIEKLLRKANIIRAKYGREPRRFLVILTASSKVAEKLRNVAEKEGVELIIGKVAS